MELNEEAVVLLASLLNTTPGKIKEYAEAEDAEQQIKSLNADNLKKKFDDGHKKAMKLTSKELVSALKNEFDVDISGETPLELAQSLKEGISGRDADDISEETIKASPVYKALQSDLTRAQQEQNKIVEREVKKLVKEKEEHFNKELKNAKKSVFLTEMEIQAEKWLESEGAILNPDPEKRKKQIKRMVNEIASYNDFDKDDDGNFLISKDGTPLTNKEGHNANLKDLFRENDYLFTFKTVQERQSSGINPNASGSSGQKKFEHFKGEVPKDEKGMQDLRTKAVNRELSREALKEVEAAYAEQQNN